jgi:hypothetical protein
MKRKRGPSLPPFLHTFFERRCVWVKIEIDDLEGAGKKGKRRLSKIRPSVAKQRKREKRK